jgi:restriction endonuclease
MATLSMIEAQAAAELAKLLYHFLPGTFSSVTWPDVAARFCLEGYWPGGSKLPAITHLLRNTLESHRDRFCDLIVAVVQEGIAYRIKKGNPVKREEIDEINRIILKVQFKIPELHDRAFLNGLSSSEEPDGLGTRRAALPVPEGEIEKLKRRFLTLFAEPDSQKRGFAFEAFLNDFFVVHGFDPHGSFKILGEQIDGSFEWNGNTFLVEARWRKKEANAADLLVLRGKAEKSEWTRGLFISINGFSDLATPTLQIGRKANLLAMSGQDLILILERHWTLHEALRAKLRYTGETAEAYKPLTELKK